MDHSSHLHLFKVLPLSTPLDACPVDPGRGPIAQGLMATLLVTRAREVPPRKARQGPRTLSRPLLRSDKTSAEAPLKKQFVTPLHPQVPAWMRPS